MAQLGGRAGIGGHQLPNQGRTDSWLTPPHIIDVLGPEFDLDPCACEDQPFRTARRMIAPPEDGLSVAWEGSVWLNPPYGNEIARWLDRMSRHNNGVALIFARTDTDWWHEYIASKASAVLFIRGRLHFYRPDGTRAKHNAGGPSALIAYSHDAIKRLEKSRIDGWLVRNP